MVRFSSVSSVLAASACSTSVFDLSGALGCVMRICVYLCVCVCVCGECVGVCVRGGVGVVLACVYCVYSLSVASRLWC